MCGRAYSTFTEEEIRLRYFNKQKVKLPPFKPNFNMAPTHEVPVVFEDEKHERQLGLFRWGLVPFWAKDIKIGNKMINARSETLAEKPAFRNAFKKRRCVVPLSGFIEWKRDGDEKRPFRIYLKDSPVMSVAGIWETWAPEGQEPLHSFAIITTDANPFMARIHDRMPVILDEKGTEAWLDAGSEDVAGLGRLLKPCEPAILKSDEISTLINSPKNNREEVIAPLKAP